MSLSAIFPREDQSEKDMECHFYRVDAEKKFCGTVPLSEQFQGVNVVVRRSVLLGLSGDLSGIFSYRQQSRVFFCFEVYFSPP